MELLKKKQGLEFDNKKRKEDLVSLDKQLEEFIEVSLSRFFVWRMAADVCVGCETDSEDAGEGCLRGLDARRNEVIHATRA
jgi:hypothetical protein